MNKLYIVMPAYNEEENIERVVLEWYRVLEGKDSDSKLVVADSGSTDQTHSLLLELKSQYPQIEILNDTFKQHGPKLLALYRYAINDGADYIFQTDSDGQTNPEEFMRFWNDRNTYDAVIGFRSKRGDGKSRAFVEKVVCLLLKMFFRIDVPDANAPFRLMKSELVNKYIDRFDDEYNIPNIMFTTFFVYYKEKVLFKDISFKPRTSGKNSINIRKIFCIGIRALKGFSEFKKSM